MAEPGGILLEWIGEGEADAALLEAVRADLESAFGLPVRCRTVGGVPAETWDPRRGQRASTGILRWILGHAPGGAEKVIGITDADLFIPVLTFVFGAAQVGGRAAVVSAARLRQEYDGGPAARGRIAARLLKECQHELGHTFGLVHCADAACVMHRSNSLLDVDRKAAHFCAGCRRQLWEQLAQGGAR
jgi:archaemetzincin